MKSKKRYMNRIIRITLSFIISIVLALYIYKLYTEIMHTELEPQNIETYTYNNNAKVNYNVFLSPNNLYNANSLNEGKIYMTNLVDYIDATFAYEFTGDENVGIKGNYKVSAIVQGFTIKDDNVINIWEKEFPLIENKNFSFSDPSYSIKENVKLKLIDYNTFVKGIIETTEIGCDTSLTLLMDINMTGSTDKGTFEENITPNIVIPLNTPLFEITTNNIEKPGAIQEMIQVQQPIDKNQVIFYSVIIGICALGLILLAFFIKSAPKKDPLENALNKIFKKHGDRLVALTNNVDIINAKNVVSIDDLVRLSDEINKPIFYKYSDNYKEINKFFITNDDEIYVFDLEDLEPKEEEIIKETSENKE